MKRMIAILLTAALLASSAVCLTSCGKESEANENGESEVLAWGLDGGWEKPASPVITEELKKVFDQAVSTLTGVEYIPVAYLGSQVVAGTNHSFLTKAAATVPGAEAYYAIVTIYENLEGKAEILNAVETDISAENGGPLGGWTETETPEMTDEAKEALAKACETLAGVEYTPVALLATQVVSGTNYRILCESRATVPGSVDSYTILVVYQDLQGGAEIIETYPFEKEEYTKTENPLVEYGCDEGSLENAEKDVGFKLAFPESLKPDQFIVISGQILEIRFDAGYIRKAEGSDDISGDWNEYAEITEKQIGGKDVTLKGFDGKIYLAIWTDGGYTYCVGMQDGAAEDAMASYVEAVK
ncbi:MAG: hypothetical protein IKX85_03600 [Clostridia bacterium]|nr:hypothetical protein [Clostridia bacterium]